MRSKSILKVISQTVRLCDKGIKWSVIFLLFKKKTLQSAELAQKSNPKLLKSFGDVIFMFNEVRTQTGFNTMLQ